VKQSLVSRLKEGVRCIHPLGQLELHHSSTPAAAIFRLLVHCYTPSKIMVNLEPTQSVPARQQCINANEIGWIEIGFLVVIEEVNESINKHPHVSF
jgi:hypothetical protein